MVTDLLVPDREAWRAWLDANHATATEAWVVLRKKREPAPTSLAYDEALEEAACYGWVDGLVRARDEVSYRQRFSPRRAKGSWTARNAELAERLIAEGRMQAAGLEAIDRAKAAGRYPGPG